PLQGVGRRFDPVSTHHRMNERPVKIQAVLFLTPHLQQLIFLPAASCLSSRNASEIQVFSSSAFKL
ncbi:MAG: hypothetical protein Q4A11_06320, partial [Brachymonas sp.]|nr:hypothetical protein [Brachymonas sp.]